MDEARRLRLSLQRVTQQPHFAFFAHKTDFSFFKLLSAIKHLYQNFQQKCCRKIFALSTGAEN